MHIKCFPPSPTGVNLPEGPALRGPIPAEARLRPMAELSDHFDGCVFIDYPLSFLCLPVFPSLVRSPLLLPFSALIAVASPAVG